MGSRYPEPIEALVNESRAGLPHAVIAYADRLRALLIEARDVIRDMAPGHTVLLAEIDAALNPKESPDGN